MEIYELLSELPDKRNENGVCDFNGYLEDYLSVSEDEEANEVLRALFETDGDLRIVVNMRIGVNKESISNSIIRYKDVFKLGDSALKIPYIVYTKKEKALVLTKKEYIYAKAYYYALTEPNGRFVDAKNDCVALDMSNKDLVVETLKLLDEKKAGYVQRGLDRKYYENYDASYEYALKLAENIKENIFAKIEESEDKESFINSCVEKWFLIKKFVYVQFMIDKDALRSKFENNIKLQRNKAKENADSIRFVSISEMWKGPREIAAESNE